MEWSSPSQSVALQLNAPVTEVEGHQVGSHLDCSTVLNAGGIHLVESTDWSLSPSVETSPYKQLVSVLVVLRDNNEDFNRVDEIDS